MLLFRSEEDVAAWCRARARPVGAVVPAVQLQALAVRWYGDRLDPAWRPRTPAASRRVLAGVGLTGAFWRLG
jgi:hypothetical protein